MSFTTLTDLDAAWKTGTAGTRLEAVRAAGKKLHDRLRAGKTARSVRTYDLVTVPYPARFGFNDAASLPLPYLMITNRMQLVTFDSPTGVKRLLVNPTDYESGRGTPFFKRLADKYGRTLTDKLIATFHGTVESRLAEAGLRGDDIDYVTFDHLHTQDVRRLLRDWVPRAKLLVMRDEAAIFERLHPLQSDWYNPTCLEGISPDRIVRLDGDVLLGDGVALVRTPGHTVGNHSIVLHTDRGLWAISENGIAVDAYTPQKSRIAGLASHAAACGVEVILNANTRELSLDQYTSMVLEKSLVDECPDGSGFLQHFPSSELTASWLSPGLGPTYRHGAITHGAEPNAAA